MNQGSVSQLLEEFKEGDEAAIKKIWERYCSRLVRLAKQKLPAVGRRAADEEDVALTAFHSLCRGAREGRFPELENRDNLWALLVFITARKAANLVRHELAEKRGKGKVRGESAFGDHEASDGGKGLHAVFGEEPGPASLAAWSEEYNRLLDRLGDPTLREIARMRVDGYSVDEIAAVLGRARRTIARKLQLIRKMWLVEFER
jgi:DNA-directed RNA polymerase specialized sigma24 family protein